MTIVTRRCFHFVRGEIYTDEHGEKQRKVHDSFIVHPSSLPQLIPDWCKDDDTFKQAQIDGHLRIVN